VCKYILAASSTKVDVGKVATREVLAHEKISQTSGQIFEMNMKLFIYPANIIAKY
jgi:hypothetical protein